MITDQSAVDANARPDVAIATDLNTWTDDRIGPDHRSFADGSTRTNNDAGTNDRLGMDLCGRSYCSGPLRLKMAWLEQGASDKAMGVPRLARHKKRDATWHTGPRRIADDRYIERRAEHRLGAIALKERQIAFSRSVRRCDARDLRMWITGDFGARQSGGRFQRQSPQ